jgi:hypothetical protein
MLTGNRDIIVHLLMSSPTQLVNLFSPNPNDTHSGRSTPSIVREVDSGRDSALTIDSNATGAISFDMQLIVTNAICPIPHQGSLSVLDPTCRRLLKIVFF